MRRDVYVDNEWTVEWRNDMQRMAGNGEGKEDKKVQKERMRGKERKRHER